MGVKRYSPVDDRIDVWGGHAGMQEDPDGGYIIYSDLQKRDELVRGLWIMREWVAKCDAVLAKANAIDAEEK